MFIQRVSIKAARYDKLLKAVVKNRSILFRSVLFSSRNLTGRVVFR